MSYLKWAVKNRQFYRIVVKYNKMLYYTFKVRLFFINKRNKIFKEINFRNKKQIIFRFLAFYLILQVKKYAKNKQNSKK